MIEIIETNNNEKDIDLNMILSQIKELDNKFDLKIKIDSHKNKMFDNMHDELMDYKNNIVNQSLNGILIDIIQLIDSNNRSISAFDDKECTEENYLKLINYIKGISEDLSDILYRENTEIYICEDENINVKKQKIIETIETDNITLDNKIAKKILPGYDRNGQIIRQEKIAIYKYKERK